MTQSKILHVNFTKQITRSSHQLPCFVYWSHFAVLVQQSDQENSYQNYHLNCFPGPTAVPALQSVTSKQNMTVSVMTVSVTVLEMETILLMWLSLWRPLYWGDCHCGDHFTEVTVIVETTLLMWLSLWRPFYRWDCHCGDHFTWVLPVSPVMQPP